MISDIAIKDSYVFIQEWIPLSHVGCILSMIFTKVLLFLLMEQENQNRIPAL